MPNVVITLTMSEADGLKARKALCNRTGVEETTANAKIVLAEIIKDLVIQEERRASTFTPITIT